MNKKASRDRPPPPLTHADVADIVSTLEWSLDTHRAWFKKFQATLVCRTPPDATDLRKDGYRRGEFSGWYKKKVNIHLRHRPEFEKVLDQHQQLHEVARELADRIRQGGNITPDEYQNLVENSDRFSQGVRALHAEARMLLSDTDPLTGVATRFAMVPRLEQERERARRTGNPCSVGMMDMDRFKPINDTYGHRAGDMVLTEVTRYMQHHLRQYDQIYRYGGEEFVLLLPDTAPGRAKRVLDRLRRGLKRQSFRLDDKTALSVSASFGIAALLPDVSVRMALDQADRALYDAKSAGRNRVHVWEDDAEDADPAAMTRARA